MKGDVFVRHSLGVFTTDGERIFHRVTGAEIDKPAFIYDMNSGHTFFVGDIYDCYKRMSRSRMRCPYTEIYEFENIITRLQSKSLDVLCTVMNYFLTLSDGQSREFLRKTPQDIEQILALKMQEGF